MKHKFPGAIISLSISGNFLDFDNILNMKKFEVLDLAELKTFEKML